MAAVKNRWTLLESASGCAKRDSELLKGIRCELGTGIYMKFFGDWKL